VGTIKQLQVLVLTLKRTEKWQIFNNNWHKCKSRNLSGRLDLHQETNEEGDYEMQRQGIISVILITSTALATVASIEESNEKHCLSRLLKT